MKKTVLYFLIVLVSVLLLAAGGVAYLYSRSGNARLQHYLEGRLQQETGLPVRMHTFRLTRGHLYFIATLGREASLGFEGGFDLWSRRLNGRYLLKATQAHYRHYTLRQAHIDGHIHGTIDDLKLDGRGTLLDAPVQFRLAVRQRIPQDITVQARKLPLDELMSLAGQPPIVHGELNADILMPSIGKKGSKGRVIAQLSQARFDPEQIARLYHYTLPADSTALRGNVEVNLAGEDVRFEGKILSDLVTIRLTNGQANLTDQNAACDVDLDTRELAPLTQNTLHGPLKLSGTLKYDAIGIQGRATTQSLGGTVSINYTKNIRIRIQKASLSKVLHLVGQPDYAAGAIDGRLTLDSPKAHEGRYVLKLTKGTLHTATLNAHLGTALPPQATVTLTSRGEIKDGILTGQTQLRSNLLYVTLSQTRLDITDQTLATRYRLHIPNPLLLAGKKGKGVPVTLTGKLTQKPTLHVSGQAKGLGKKLTFDYSGDHLKILADDVAVGRLLASTGQPMAVSGVADADIDLAALDPLRGTIRLNAPKLQTHPAAMKQLIGTPLDTHLSLRLNGRAKKGILFGTATLKSPLATLSMPQVIFDTKDNAFSTPFDLKIPELAKLAPLIDTKLQGPFATQGKIKTGVETRISGTSTSLGGSLTYRYVGTRADVTMTDVPLPKLLHLIDKPDAFNGTTNGTFVYDTDRRSGQAHLKLDRFQFKPGALTKGVKLLMHKDLSEIIYDRTTLEAQLRGDRIDYTLHARGHRSVFAIRDGRLNTQAQTHNASFGLQIDALDVIGTIKGKTNDPKVTVLPGKMLRGRLKKKARSIVKKQIDKNLKGAPKKLLKNLPKLF